IVNTTIGCPLFSGPQQKWPPSVYLNSPWSVVPRILFIMGFNGKITTFISNISKTGCRRKLGLPYLGTTDQGLFKYTLRGLFRCGPHSKVVPNNQTHDLVKKVMLKALPSHLLTSSAIYYTSFLFAERVYNATKTTKATKKHRNSKREDRSIGFGFLAQVLVYRLEL
ncbi:unnamed protein product, partial [Medioppia subpectinata]